MVSATERGNAVYLVAGGDGRLHPVKDHKVMSVWNGNATTLGWPVEPNGPLTLITVVRRDLQVVCAFVMRLDVKNKRISQEGVAKVLRDADLVTRKPTDKLAAKAIGIHLKDLPGDWRTQLAVYFDCPAAHFADVLVGGPLALARQTKMTVDEVIAHLLEKG